MHRSLNDIGMRSLALSEKGKVARVLDKAQDLQEVVGLVEKLRQAILIYQVSIRHRQSQIVDAWDRCRSSGQYTIKSSS